MVEDRDTGYVILDPRDPPAHATIVELRLEGVELKDAENAHWYYDDLNRVLRAICPSQPEPTYVLGEDWPIPAPEIVDNWEEYEERASA